MGTTRMFWTTALVGLCLGLAACDSAEEPGPVEEGGLTCGTAEYLAFDPVHHAPQDLRLAKIDEMLAAFAGAKETPATAEGAAAAILAIYEDPEANLAAKVAGRKDFHTAAEVGPAIDAAIRDGIERLRIATTAHEISVAKQIFEKAGFQRWLYLSVMQELAEPTKEHYDEAYGYFGSGATNAVDGRRSMSLLATKRDATNGTTLADELFASLLDGRCAIEEALAASGTEELALDADPAYAAVVAEIDRKLQLAFAYSVGHELFEIDAERANAEEATVKAFEGEGFFRTLEPYLLAAGGEKATLAAELRTAFDDALTKSAAGDTAWVATFPAVDLLTRIEAAYGIDVKG